MRQYFLVGKSVTCDRRGNAMKFYVFELKKILKNKGILFLLGLPLLLISLIYFLNSQTKQTDGFISRLEDRRKGINEVLESYLENLNNPNLSEEEKSYMEKAYDDDQATLKMVSTIISNANKGNWAEALTLENEYSKLIVGYAKEEGTSYASVKQDVGQTIQLRLWSFSIQHFTILIYFCWDIPKTFPKTSAICARCIQGKINCAFIFFYKFFKKKYYMTSNFLIS